MPTAQSFSQNENLVRTSKNLLKKRKLNFSRSALFHMENRVCVKYFVNDCRLGMLGGGKKTHIIFSSTLTVQSRLLFDPKKQGNCKWLAKKGVEKMQEEHQQAFEEYEQAVALLSDDLQDCGK